MVKREQKRSEDYARCPLSSLLLDPPHLDVDVIKLLCYIYVLFCFYGRNMLFSLIVQLEPMMQ